MCTTFLIPRVVSNLGRAFLGFLSQVLANFWLFCNFAWAFFVAHQQRICLQFQRFRFNLSVRKISGEGNGNPLQYSCLGNPMDRRAWWTTVLRVERESDTTWWLNGNSKVTSFLIAFHQDRLLITALGKVFLTLFQIRSIPPDRTGENFFPVASIMVLPRCHCANARIKVCFPRNDTPVLQLVMEASGSCPSFPDLTLWTWDFNSISELGEEKWGEKG